MQKLLLFLIAIIISCNSFAQTPDTSRIDKIFSSKEAIWSTKVDTTTNWGKWLMSTKPYWDKIIEAERQNAKAMINNAPILPNITPDDYLKRSSAVMADSYNVIQNITPPEELKTYHAIYLKGYGIQVTNNQQAHEAVAEAYRLGKEAKKELDKVFKRHGVPQNIMDGFLKG